MKRIFSALSPFIAVMLLNPDSLSARELPLSPNAKAAIPVFFMENKGQVFDEHHNKRNDIDFKLSAGNVNVFIGKGQLHYQWNKVKGEDLETYRIDVVLEGADIYTPAIAEELQNCTETYYTSQYRAELTVRAFKKIVYKNIYPNIDWVLQTADGGIKYNFILHPGAKVKDIKLRYQHADLSFTEKGLVASTPFGSITEEMPYSYIEETGKEIPSSFVLTKDLLQFDVQSQSQTVVIDPLVQWATYFGIQDNVKGYAVAADKYGNSYLGGSTNQTNMATLLNAHQDVYGGGTSDGFIAKFNDTGWRVWCTYYGGESSDVVLGLGCDSSGYLYVMGQTYSYTDSNAISTNGAYQRKNGGSPFNGQSAADVFLAKFNPAGSGSRVWSTYYGGTQIELPNTLAVALDGTFAIGGYTNSSNNLASTGAFKTGIDDGFIAKFNSNGMRVWGTYYVGEVRALAFDTSGNIYAGGQANSLNNTATSGAHQSQSGGGLSEGYIAKFNPLGSRVWGTYYGDTGQDVVTALACDVYGNLYVGGQTTSGANIATTGAYKTNYSGGYLDGFLARFTTSDGVRRWGTYFGGNTGVDLITNIVCDSSTKVWVIGNTSSTAGIATSGAYKTNYSGPPPGPPTFPLPSPTGDVFFAKFTLPGTLKYCTYFGGAEIEQNLSLCYNTGNVYFGGTTVSSYGGCSTANGYQAGPLANIPPPPPPAPPASPFPSGFLAKWSADTSIYFQKRFTDTVLCLGDVKQVAIGCINPFRSSNVFTVQMSDINGGWSNPVNIGTSNTNVTGNVSFTVPLNTTPGVGYRIRVIASAPADTTFFDNGINIRVSSYPNPKVMLTGAVCAGGVVDIIDTGSSPLSTTFSWKGPNGITGAGTNLHYTNVQFADSGYYVLIAANYGCVRKDSVHIVPSPNPVSPSIHSNSPVCSGDTLHVWGTTVTSPVEWYWFKPAGYFPNAPSDTFIYASAVTDAGVYKAQAVYNGCFSPMDSITVVVNQSVIPTLTVTASPGTVAQPGTQVTFNSAATNEGSTPSYQWLKNGLFISGATSSTYTATMAIDLHTGDTICVRMTSSALCPRPTTVTTCAGVVVDLGVENTANDVLQLYPNPNTGNFVVNAKTKGTLYVNNIQGQQVAEYNISTGKTNITMPKSVSAGVYVGRFVQDDGKTGMVRIVIQ
jgi:hypothetical protein